MVVYNRLIPFGGFQAMAFWPFIFSKSRLMSDRRKNHERIHLRQQREVMLVSLVLMLVLCITCMTWWCMAIVPTVYYLLYLTEYAIRLITHGRTEAYSNISFEQEALANEFSFGYLKCRKPFAWVRYLGMKTYTNVNNASP